jgi:hypothetical protein
MAPSGSDESGVSEDTVTDESVGTQRLAEERPGHGAPPLGRDGDENPHRVLLLDCLANPERGVERLPFVLTLLESDERQIRLLAAMTGCVVAIETDDEEIVEYLVRRMSDRLTGDELSLELTTALDYLSSHYSEQVDHLLAEIHDDDVPLPEVGDFTRNYYSQEFDREDVGRTKIAGKDVENPHEIAEDSGDEDEQLKRDRTSDDDESDEHRHARRSAAADRDDGTTDPSEIADRSRFDEVYVEGQYYQGRYATVYETLVGRGGDEQAICLRVLNHPDELSGIYDFEKAVGERVGEWAVVGDHANVVQVWDWGLGPRPWLATAFTAGTIAGWDHPGFEAGLAVACSLSEAVSYVHQHGVVHGGIDPRNVVFPGESFTEDTVEYVPLLDNVGLIHAYRDHLDVQEVLDLRFTAPEYYSDQFGRIDHMTDIYQLGATCFYLFTGQPPYTGDTEGVREGILAEGTPAPSAVADVPSLADDLIAKALARDKIRRYETAEQFHQELQSIASEVDTGPASE